MRLESSEAEISTASKPRYLVTLWPSSFPRSAPPVCQLLKECSAEPGLSYDARVTESLTPSGVTLRITKNCPASSPSSEFFTVKSSKDPTNPTENLPSVELASVQPVESGCPTPERCITVPAGFCACAKQLKDRMTKPKRTRRINLILPSVSWRPPAEPLPDSF